MDADSLEKLFVGRDKTMKTVLERLLASTTGDEKHYFLLVGPRGTGKTHFVALAYHRLMRSCQSSDSKSRFMVAYLNEEEWGVASYLDFLVRILQSLSDPDTDDRLSQVIEQIIELHSRNPQLALTNAEQSLTEHLGDQTLILICENLVDLFRGLGAEGQKKWRAFIQQSPYWAILASTPALFQDVQIRESPFYAFFTIRHMKLLDFETALELLCRKAVHEAKHDLAKQLRTPLGRARVRALHHLAGGNHRAYVVLFDFLERESLDELVTPFMRMVDDLTPYYQDRMRQLAPRQRKILEFLCHNARPIEIKRIAERCLMSQQTAAKQISELTKLGFIGKNVVGQNTLCELTEPLMRICIEVKDNRSEHLKLFVEFLRHWFSSREIQTRIRHFDSHARSFATPQRVHLEAAMCDYIADRREPLLDALDVEGRRCLRAKDYDRLVAIQGRLVRERGNAKDHQHYIFGLSHQEKHEAAIAAANLALTKYPKNSRLMFELASSEARVGHDAEALRWVDCAIENDENEPMFRCFRGGCLGKLGRFDEVLRNERALLELEPEHRHSNFRIGMALVELFRFEEAELELEAFVGFDPSAGNGWSVLAYSQYKQEKFLEALSAATRAAELLPNSENERFHVALLNAELGRFEDGLRSLDEILKRNPSSERALCMRSLYLQEVSQFEESVRTCDRLLGVNPEHYHSLLVKGESLLKLGRIDEAVESLVGLTRECDQEHKDYLVYGAELLRHVNRNDESLKLAKRATILSPNEAGTWIAQAQSQLALGDIDGAKQSGRQAAELSSYSLEAKLFLCEIEVHSSGISAVANELGDVLKSEEGDKQREMVSFSIARIIRGETVRVGPIAMARQMGNLRRAIGRLMNRGLLGEALTIFLIQNLEGEVLIGAEWEAAMGFMEESLGSLSQCKIPLQMLSVATRYGTTGDRRALLELPLEQRKLLEGMVGGPPGVEADVIESGSDS